MEKKTGYPSIDRTHLKNVPEEFLNPALLMPVSMLGIFLKVNAANLDEYAIQDGLGKEYTKFELLHDVKCLIKSFHNLGLREGDTLGILSENCYELVVSAIAANAIGMRLLFLNESDPENINLQRIEEFSVNVLLTHNQGWFKVAKNFQVFLEHDLFFVDIISREIIVNNENLLKKYKVFWDLITENSPEEEILVESLIKKYSFHIGNNIFLQTSGSTSEPKILPFSNLSLYSALIFASNSTGTKTRDKDIRRVLVVLSARLPFGFMTTFVNVLGGQEVIFAKEATTEAIANYYRYNANFIYGTPTMLRAFIDNTPESADLSNLKGFFCGGFSTPDKLFEEAREFFDKHGATEANVRNNYGIGEGLGIGTSTDIYFEHKPGTCGHFYYGPEWLIVDENLNEVKYDEVGELIVSSLSLCDGYWNNPEATNEAFFDYRGKRFFRTGDYVSLGSDNLVRFHGRKKRFYQPLGAKDKVSCEAIEKILYSLPFVKQAAVVPVLDEETLVTSKAFLVIDENFDKIEAEMRVLMKFSDSLQKFQRPKSIAFLEKIPLMSSGKIDYLLLHNL